MPQYCKPFFILFVLLFANLCAANTTLKALAQHPYWLDLLHYHNIGFIPHYASQVDEQNFFLAANGQQDPYAELLANLAAFKDSNHSATPDNHAQCQFPARYYWLKQQLPELVNYQMACPEFNQWFNLINPEKIYLVFPAAYLNSPSSMYGHTLFRIKKRNNDNALLDYAVNYAANPDPNDNELVFSYKGLTGNYPGVFSIMPYYQKVKEYGFLESRDIWEYELALTEEEVAQLTRHVWEMRNVYMDYYFFTENCSYQLLTMIDASSERISLSKDFKIRAIPVDTIKALTKANLVKNTLFRASTLNKMQAMQLALNTKEVHLAKALVEQTHYDNTQLITYPNEQQAQILELAYEYSRYLAAKKKSTLPHLAQRSILLLSERSKLNNTQVYPEVIIPAVRDDQGHETQRLAINYGEQQNKNYWSVDYRPSYHDLLAPPAGFIKNATLEMFSFGFQQYQNEDLKFSYLDIVHIQTLNPTSVLTTPTSWQVKFGLNRPEFAEEKLAASLAGGYGFTRTLLAGNLSMLLSGQAYWGGHLDKNHYIAAGPQLNYLYQGEKISGLINFQHLFPVSGEDKSRQELNTALAYNVTKNWQWRISWQYLVIDKNNNHNASIGLQHYF